jgi:L-alanine-DL-glutamate epimerase-like enolase superfamily enzyme
VTEVVAEPAADPIRSLECFDCKVPLPRPLQVGAATVSHRSYVIVRLTAESGAQGTGVSFGRGLPVAAIIAQALAPIVVGADSLTHQVVAARLRGAYWPYAEGGLFATAASAIDLALWDLAARRASLPLSDMLGRHARSVPVCVVASYGGDHSDDALDALRDEVGGFLERGFRAIKLIVGARAPESDRRRVAATRALAGDDVMIVLDAFRSFSDVETALQRLRLLEPYRIAYLEDPFSESLEWLNEDLRRRSGMSLGLGESLGGHREHRRLIERGIVDVLRADVTVVGGVREFLASAALASAHGLALSPHAHPEVHVQLAAAIPNLYGAGIEYTDPALGMDAFYRLLATRLEIRDGRAIVPARPGLGLDIDWDAVSTYAVEAP